MKKLTWNRVFNIYLDKKQQKLSFPFPRPFTSGSRPTFVLHVSEFLNFFSLWSYKQLWPCLVFVLAKYHQTSYQGSDSAFLVTPIRSLSSMTSHIPSWLHPTVHKQLRSCAEPSWSHSAAHALLVQRSRAQLGKASSTAATCTLKTWRGASFNKSTCLLYCVLGKTVHQKRFLSVL